MVSGSAALSGTLNVSLIGGFTPKLGDVFTIIASGLVTGQFITTNLPLGASLIPTPTGVQIVF